MDVGPVYQVLIQNCIQNDEAFCPPFHFSIAVVARWMRMDKNALQRKLRAAGVKAPPKNQKEFIDIRMIGTILFGDHENATEQGQG